MITSFFKPKSGKVKPAPSQPASSPASKRARDDNNEEDGEHTPSKRAKQLVAEKKLSNEVTELLSYLDEPKNESAEEENEDGEKGEEEVVAWKNELKKHFSTPSFQRLASFIKTERLTKKIYPEAADTFSALNLTPLDKVKVVIVGQDPYHQPGQAHGLCFSVKKGVKVPPSLRNMYKEMVNDKDVPNVTKIPTHGFLERWAKQGVLMINNVLTVQDSKPNCHKKKGWELVTDEIIRAVNRRAKADGRGVVFLLWGKPATEKAKTALGGTSRHTIIATSHPSPLGATKTNSPFMGSKCFSRANQALKEMGYDEIDWRVDGPL